MKSYITLEELVTPTDGARVLVDHWWVHCPEGVLFVDGRPQCNRDERVAGLVRNRVYPGAGLTLVPVAYVPPELAERG